MVKRNEFCYAGKWSYVLDLASGVLKPCYASQIRQNIFSDTDSQIKITAIGSHCRSPYCMNSSHFMALGIIPSVDTPSYESLRNRRCVDGSEWYNETMKCVLSKKFVEGNSKEVDEFSVKKQAIKDSVLSFVVVFMPIEFKNYLKRVFSIRS